MSEAAGSLPTAPPASKMSEAGRVAGIFFSPIKTFQDIARKPTWLVPLVAVIATSLLFTVLVVPRIDWEAQIRDQVEKAAEKSGQKVNEQIVERQVAIVKKMGPVISYVGAGLGPPIFALVLALIYFAIIRLGGGMVSYEAAFSVICFSSLPRSLLGVVTGLAAMKRESLAWTDVASIVPSSLSFFLSKEQVGPVLFALSQSVELFLVWSTILTIIGLATVSTWSRGKCAAVVLVPWAVFLAIQAAIAGVFMR